MIKKYMQKWEGVYAKGLLLTDLRRIKRNNPEYLEDAIQAATQVDIFDTTLFVYYYCKQEKGSKIFNQLLEEVFNESNRQFIKLADLVEEENVKLDELKKALELINKDEKWKKNGNKHSKKVAKELLKNDYKADLYNKRREFVEGFAELWQALVVLWGCTEDEQFEDKLVEICRKCLDSREHLDKANGKRIREEFCKDLLAPIREGEYPGEDIYIRSRYILRMVLEPSAHEGSEVHWAGRLEMDQIDDFTKIVLKKYVKGMLEDGQYRALSSFLHKTSRNDYVNLYDMSKAEFWNLMMTSESERLAECYFRQENLRNDLAKWYQWVEERVTNEACLSWCQWSCFFYAVEDTVCNPQIDEDEFFEKINAWLPQTNYPFDKTRNLKRIVQSVIYIFSEIFKRDWHAWRFIELLGNNNPFCFENKMIYMDNPASWQYPEKEHNWGLNKEHFWRNLDGKNKVDIYMNSPLRFVWEFRDFILNIVNEYGHQVVGSWFGEYELGGNLAYRDPMARAKDKMKFSVSPRYVKTDYVLIDGERRDSAFYSGLMTVEEKYYEANEAYFDKLKYSCCEFRICGFEPKGLNDGVILIDNVKGGLMDDTKDSRKDMQEVLNWVKEIGDKKQFYPLTKSLRDKICLLKDVGMERDFAVENLRTMLALSEDSAQLRMFIGQINYGRIDRINPFKYIPKRNYGAKLSIRNGKKEFLNGVIYPMARELSQNPRVLKQDKVNIYMNSCLKHFYALGQFYKDACLTGDDFRPYQYENSEYTAFLFDLQYQGMKNEYHIFTLNPEAAICLSEENEIEFTWKYSGDLPTDEKESSYRGTIGKMDVKNRSVEIGELYPHDIKEEWKQFLRYFYDLKKNPNYTYISQIQQKAAGLKVDFYQGSRIWQLATKVEELFDLIGKDIYTEEYSIFWLRQCLKIIPLTPFKDVKNVLSHPSIQESDKVRLRQNGFLFFENRVAELKEKKANFRVEDLLEIYDLSPYQLVITREELLARIDCELGIAPEELEERYQEYLSKFRR